VFAGTLWSTPVPHVLLAMQKVEGSNPFSRFRKGGHLQPFLVGRSRLVRRRRVGLTPDSPRADRRPLQEKRPVCRPSLVRPNRSPSAGLQKVRCRTAAAVTPTPAATARSCGQRPPAGYQRSRSLGPVRFQSGYREADHWPAQRPRRAMAPTAANSPKTASEAAARSPSPAAWAVVIARGSTAEAVAYIGSGRLLATGLGSC
jgi:hypothetical protein